jgi:hypothetical protein
MGIQRYFIDNKINKILDKVKKLKEKRTLSKIDAIAVFVDEYIAFNDKEFTKLQKLMGLDHTHFNIITYKEKKSNFNEFRGTVILSSDIDWKGRIKSKDVQETLNKKYDLLIDYTQADQQKKQLIVAICNAGFKVGFSDKKDELYDFMIAVNPSKVSLFNEELVRYLKILKLA